MGDSYIDSLLDFLKRREINNKTIFLYLVILISLLILFTRIIDIHLGHLLTVILGTIVIYILTIVKIEDTSDFNKEIEFKLYSLIPDKSLMINTNNFTNYFPDFFYLDIDLINLFYNIVSDIGLYNTDSYMKALISANNVLMIRADIEKKLCDPPVPPILIKNFDPKLNGNSKQNKSLEKPKVCDKLLDNAYENYQVAENQVTLCLNYLHSLVISVPSSIITDTKLKMILRRAHILLKRNLDIIVSKIEKNIENNGINYKTKFITDYDSPKPYDKEISKIASGVSSSITGFNFF